jgi:hypothetical protein
MPFTPPAASVCPQRGHAAAEIVQREAVAARRQGEDEGGGLVHVGDRAVFRDFKAQLFRRHVGVVDQGGGELVEALVAQRAARQVDAAHLQAVGAGAVARQPVERVGQHPAVDLEDHV